MNVAILGTLFCSNTSIRSGLCLMMMMIAIHNRYNIA